MDLLSDTKVLQREAGEAQDVAILGSYFADLFDCTSNNYDWIRLNDLAQIWRVYSPFEIFISFVPFIYALAPDLLRSLLGPVVGLAVFVALSLLFFAGSSLLILTQYPFIYPEANWTCMFVLLASCSISTIPILNIVLPTHMDLSICTVTAATIASWFFVKYGCVHRAPDSANEITQRQNIDDTDSDDSESVAAKPCKFALQDVVLGLFFVSSILFMMYMGSYIAGRSPRTSPVRDVIHSKFRMASSIRERKSFPHFQFSNIVCMTMILSMLGIMIFARSSVNIRKTAFVYSIMAIVRSLCGFMTSLPPPCAGSPNCPCSNPDVLSRAEREHADV